MGDLCLLVFSFQSNLGYPSVSADWENTTILEILVREQMLKTAVTGNTMLQRLQSLKLCSHLREGFVTRSVDCDFFLLA